MVVLQLLEEAKRESQQAAAEAQCIGQEVVRLEVAIPKLQLEAASARQQATDLQQQLSQLAQAAQVTCSLCLLLVLPVFPVCL